MRLEKKMKKVSVRMFFTVLWRGLCQALGWFFGLFGYKRDGKFAKCVWGLFATSAAATTAIIALALFFVIGREVYERYFAPDACELRICNHGQYVYDEMYFHNRGDGKGYLYNFRTGEKYITDVAWIAKPTTEDSLICFSDGKKRGYYSKYSGQVVIEPRYDHAWIFSDGLAGVEEGGHVKFIDPTGKVVIDRQMARTQNKEDYVFHAGYCVVYTNDGKHCGLMDKNGNIVVPLEYDDIAPANDFTAWKIQKGNERGVLDSSMKQLIPMQECSIYIDEGTIDVTLPDHTIRKYDMQGSLINDFCIGRVRMLEYEKDEIVYRENTTVDNGDGLVETLDEYYHPKATARLRAYVASGSYEGLMTADGRIVTMPLYKNIEAIGHDLYLCTSTNCDKVIVNGKGEIVNNKR